MEKANRHEFRALIDGADLSPELVARVDRAIQRAVLTELAGFDFGGRGIANSPLDKIIGTKGIWAKVLDQHQLEQLGGLPR